MTAFTQAILIYNPNSTGDSQAIAEKFKQDIKKLDPKCQVQLVKTTHAGHGEELGYELAMKSTRTLLISVSGDGGYHEMVNGVMRAVDEGADSPICAVLPGGNANDHYTNISDRTLLEAIAAADGLTKLDLLKVEAGETRYAHSYAGLGLTPLVAVELNKHKLSALKELWLALKTFWKFKPFKIVENGQIMTFDSLIFANIGVMAKHITLDSDSSPRDGKFEVLRWPHHHKIRLVTLLAKAVVGRAEKPQSITRLEFTTLTKIPMQMDGELLILPKDQVVVVTCAQKALRTYW